MQGEFAANRRKRQGKKVASDEWRVARKVGGPHTPVVTGSMRNWLRAERIESLRGACDGSGAKRDLAPSPLCFS